MIFRISAAVGRDRAEAHQLVEGQLVLLEFSDGEGRAVDRERRRDHVDARAVHQAGVADRRGFVDAAADLADDALADVHQLRVVAEADIGQLDLAADLDVGAGGAVDHDVGDVVARQQRLERAVAQHVVADVVEQVLLLGDRHHDVLDRDDLVDDVADFLARALGVELRELREVDRLDQGAEDRALGDVIFVGPTRFRAPARWTQARGGRGLRSRTRPLDARLGRRLGQGRCATRRGASSEHAQRVLSIHEASAVRQAVPCRSASRAAQRRDAACLDRRTQIRAWRDADWRSALRKERYRLASPVYEAFLRPSLASSGSNKVRFGLRASTRPVTARASS